MKQKKKDAEKNENDAIEGKEHYRIQVSKLTKNLQSLQNQNKFFK